jgi:hypothetical protein
MMEESETRRFLSYLSQKERKSLILWETYQSTLFANETHEEVKMTPTRAPKKASSNYPQKPLYCLTLLGT